MNVPLSQAHRTNNTPSNAFNLPYFHFDCLCCCFFLSPLVFLYWSLFLVPFTIHRVVATGIMAWILGITTVFNAAAFFSRSLFHYVWYIFLVSCTLINALIQLFILFPGESTLFSSPVFRSSGFHPLNTWLLCVYAVKRSFGKSRQHIF